MTTLFIKSKQSEVRALARDWLNPDDLADILIFRCDGELKRAVNELLHAAHDCRLGRAETERWSPAEYGAAREADAQNAFIMLIEHFGFERVRALANEFTIAEFADRAE